MLRGNLRGLLGDKFLGLRFRLYQRVDSPSFLEFEPVLGFEEVIVRWR